MRTTVTMDPDVAARLRQLARRRRTSMKALINDVLRAGLDRTDPGTAQRLRRACRHFLDEALRLTPEELSRIVSADILDPESIRWVGRG